VTLNPDSFSGLLLVVALILVRGLIVLAYNAFANVRQSNLRDLAEEGHQGAARLLSLLAKNSDLQVAYETATTLLSLAIAAIAILGFANPLISDLGESTSPMAVHIGVLLVTALLTLIFGELVPEGIGSAYANSMAMSLTRFMQALILILKPLTLIVVSVSKAIATIFKSGEKVNTVTEEEIVTLVESGQAGGSIEEEEKDMILSVLQLDETYASEVMVPRIDITALSIETSLEDALAAFINSGFSRIPLYENTIDNIKGLLYAKDLLSYWHNGSKDKVLTPRELMRPAYFVPETKRADDLLKELQTKRVHMAIVIDEFGGTAGIVTIENIIEEIIGDIQDEHDPFEEAEYLQESESEYVVDASIDIDDFNDLLDVEVPGDDSDTLGGFVYTTLGRVPVIGEEIKHEERTTHLTIRVEKVEGRRIRKLRVFIHKLDEGKPEEEVEAEESARTSAPASLTAAVTPTPDIPEVREMAESIREETSSKLPSVPAPTATKTPAPDASTTSAPSSDAVPVTQAEAKQEATVPTNNVETAQPAEPAAPVEANATTTTEASSQPAPPDASPTSAPSSDAVPVTPSEAKSETTPPTNNVEIAQTVTSEEADATTDIEEGKTIIPVSDEAPISSEAVPVEPPSETANEVSNKPDNTTMTAVPAAAAPAETVIANETVASDQAKATIKKDDAPAAASMKPEVQEAAEDGTQPDKPRQPVSERP
jgi:putative hemolysin